MSQQIIAICSVSTEEKQKDKFNTDWFAVFSPVALCWSFIKRIYKTPCVKKGMGVFLFVWVFQALKSSSVHRNWLLPIKHKNQLAGYVSQVKPLGRREWPRKISQW